MNNRACAHCVIKFSNPKLQEPPKVLSSSGIRGTKLISVYVAQPLDCPCSTRLSDVWNKGNNNASLDVLYQSSCNNENNGDPTGVPCNCFNLLKAVS